jgi:hypothetical protein
MKTILCATCVALLASACALPYPVSSVQPGSTTVAPGTAQADLPSAGMAEGDKLSEEIWCKVESECIDKLAGAARRAGEVLHLKLENGKTKAIRSNRKACMEHDVANCSVKTLIGYMPTQHMFVFTNSLYEQLLFAVVSRRTGEFFGLEAEPHLSPDGKRFVVVAVDEMNGVNHDIAIFSTSTFPPRLEWSHTPGSDGFFSFLGWDGNERIRLAVRTSGENAEADVVRAASGGWILRQPVAAVRPAEMPSTWSKPAADLAATAREGPASPSPGVTGDIPECDSAEARAGLKTAIESAPTSKTINLRVRDIPTPKEAGYAPGRMRSCTTQVWLSNGKRDIQYIIEWTDERQESIRVVTHPSPEQLSALWWRRQ